MDLHEREMESGSSGADIPTEHPHIVRRPGVCGGSPRIRGSRVAVRNIAMLLNAGESVNQILENYPHLQATWIHDAISYYLDHRQQIDQEIEDSKVENALASAGLRMDGNGAVQLPSANADGI